MYISSIKIENIRCFKKLHLDLEKKGKPILWTMILGNNSVGKSCLLRSIAIGLCDQASAAALIKELPGEFLRQNTPQGKDGYEGSIKITLKNDSTQEVYKIETTIKKKKLESPEIVEQHTEPPEDFPWEEIFVCGYGPQRASEADRSYYKYSVLDAVYTLFNYDSTLQNPELIFRRQSETVRNEWGKKIIEILMLNEEINSKENNQKKAGKRNSILLTDRGMELSGPWKGSLPLSSLSDGYRTTTTWILDFLNWQVYSRKMRKKDSIGILLIDELEQHLHPKWQRYIVNRLRNQNPNIQFITSTHSPLIAAGLSDIDDALIVNLKLDSESEPVKEIVSLDELRGMRADQILTSVAFELPIARSGDIGDKIISYLDLSLKDKLNSFDNKKLRKLHNYLSENVPSIVEFAEDRKIHNDIKNLLKKHSS